MANGALLVAGTIAFGLAAITAAGPLGLVRVVGRRMHVAAVVVIAVLFGLAPLVPRFRPDVSGIIIVVFTAVGLVRLATLTLVEPTRRTAPGTSPATPQAPTTPSSSPAPDAAARWLASAARTVVRTAEANGPLAREATRRAVRSAGRSAGRWTSRAGRALSDPAADDPSAPSPGQAGAPRLTREDA